MSFIAWITFILLEQKNKFKSHEKVCKNKDFFKTVIPPGKDNILEFNQYMKLDKMSYIIYADIESFIKKMVGFEIAPENSSTAKMVEHIRRRYSVSEIWAFDHIENKDTL